MLSHLDLVRLLVSWMNPAICNKEFASHPPSYLSGQEMDYITLLPSDPFPPNAIEVKALQSTGIYNTFEARLRAAGLN